MNTIPLRRFRVINWQAIAMFALGFWLSASLVFDCLVIPGLLSAGMMQESGFAGASYLLFGTFNHVELLCAAIVLASALVLNYRHNLSTIKLDKSIIIAGCLMAIAICYAYILTPQMSALGMSLNEFNGTELFANSMIKMHVIYWVLEASKLIFGSVLLSKFYRNSCSLI
ncbi:conserved membrane hypothetical protein [Hyella patelloides LEGE 07179]|uniref:DUF4149 domain-containing protein n=1 Tax=Hyella patelloides LEGE 07179 TaxID=945734 RepID=A0A563VU81_9CYAN|nr:hypothetical protein [Hyella patelloides]VEP15032.1 conserved membrane hypothetical protein [Hyella patelloides LEGE 07179]